MTTLTHRSKRQPDPAMTHPLLEVLRAGQSIDLLKHLHILTPDGKLNQDTRRKLKQVNHLLQFIEPLVLGLRQQGIAPNVVDHGAGKSYLGFLLYDAVFKQLAQTGSVWGIESRVDLIQTTAKLANDFGFDRMGFVLGDTADASGHVQLPKQVHIVTALHACNTATDDAIAFGLSRQAKYMVLVPCCQAEVAALLRAKAPASQESATPFAALWQRPLHTREFGSQLTNVLRCLQLEAAGYHVTVTELVGWEHSLKNELILAKKQADPQSKAVQANMQVAQQQLMSLLHETHLSVLAPKFLQPSTPLSTPLLSSL
jgi:hypothetical protein